MAARFVMICGRARRSICICPVRTGACGTRTRSRRDEVIVCESLIDALSLWCWGFRHVTAAYGVEGFTADHWAAVR